jgi:hypothetical protein
MKEMAPETTQPSEAAALSGGDLPAQAVPFHLEPLPLPTGRETGEATMGSDSRKPEQAPRSSYSSASPAPPRR